MDPEKGVLVPKMFQFAGFRLDAARSCLRAADREIESRPKSFEVLRYPIENANRLVTKEEQARRACDPPSRSVMHVRLRLPAISSFSERASHDNRKARTLMIVELDAPERK